MDQKRNIGLPPLARVMGVGRQQQQQELSNIAEEEDKEKGEAMPGGDSVYSLEDRGSLSNAE